ncbi:MAG: hypothetical protein E7614_01390 [Ruminococcaceae bacterium]|nr:hypothetical protein [Oscillospiraceae bacterium]
MLKTAEQVDNAMKIETELGESDVVFYDVRKTPFKIYGLYNPETESDFKRMPTDVASNVNEGVGALHLNTAGGRVRFSTDSPYVAIHAEMPAMGKMSHFALTGSCGFDLYIDEKNGESHYNGVFKPPFHKTEGFEAKVAFKSRKMRYFTLNFPTYSNVKNLYVGISENSRLGSGRKYKLQKPIVYYGSSITQGGCASRPGNTYESVVSQRLNIDHINLGFSGSGRGEKLMADYIASLDMCAFVMDYDHNSPSAKHLSDTHFQFYETVRNAYKSIPIIIMSRSDFLSDYEESVKRRDVIFNTYRKAISNGDKNVYFIDGESVFRGPYENMCTIDGAHPNDLGFALMADAVESTLKKAFRALEK